MDTNYMTNGLKEGACAKDVWKIYYMVPPETYFTLNLSQGIYDEHIKTIEFYKCGDVVGHNPDGIRKNERKLYEALGEFGLDSYSELIVEWRKGFGNNVIVTVYR